MRKPTNGVFAAVLDAAKKHKLLSIGTVLCAAASVLATLLPPLLLGRIVDDLTGGLSLSLAAILCYFVSLALGGILNSAQETLLEMFGQKMTHALRSEMSRKLTHLPAATLAAQNPGQIAARFSGDVDTVEALFTRHVQKRMLSAQLANRKAVASISGQVPETIHNIRTIHALGLEDYMERRYDRSIGESYAAVEKTNFYCSECP